MLNFELLKSPANWFTLAALVVAVYVLRALFDIVVVKSLEAKAAQNVGA